MDKNKLLVAIEVAEQEEKELLQELTYLRKRIASYKLKLSTPNKEPSNDLPQFDFDPTPNNGYDRSSSWVDKVAFFLNKEKRFLHAREIQELIQSEEANVDKKHLQRRVSSALTRLKKEGTAVNYKASKTNLSVFWGAPKWLDADGKPQKEYMFNKNYLVEHKAKKRVIE